MKMSSKFEVCVVSFSWWHKSLNPEVTANGVTINVVVDKILNGLYNEHIHYTC